MIPQPLYMQSKGYPAQFDRQFLADIFGTGVTDWVGLQPSPSGAARAINLTAGVVYVAGTERVGQGSYRVFSDAAAQVAIPGASTFPRLDQIIVRIYDQQYSGTVSQATIERVAGVEASGATLDNRSGAAALPANSFLLCDVLAPVGSAILVSTDMRDRRKMVDSIALPIGVPIPTSSLVLPSTRFGYYEWADGGLVDRVTFSTFFAGAGHAYNGGVDPGGSKVRKPDKRGRVSVGADAMPGGSAASRLTLDGSNARLNNPNTRGANGGVQKLALDPTELAFHVHKYGGTVGGLYMGQYPGTLTTQIMEDFPGQPHAIGPSDEGTTYTGSNNGTAGNAFNKMGPYEVDNVMVRLA